MCNVIFLHETTCMVNFTAIFVYYTSCIHSMHSRYILIAFMYMHVYIYMSQGCWKISVHQDHNLSQNGNSSPNGKGPCSPIPGLMNTGWWATQLTHKQVKDTNLKHPSEPWAHMYEINKEETGWDSSVGWAVDCHATGPEFNTCSIWLGVDSAFHPSMGR